MNLTIHTYGHIDAMFYVLNGIAMIMNSGFANLMIKTVAIVATSYYGIKAAYAGAGGRSSSHIMKVIAMIIVIDTLLIPRTEMFIEDSISKQRDKVDNLPYGFAVPIGFMESFGFILTNAFEQAFTAAGSSNYSEYGMVFGARLLQEARNFKINTPEFAHNMDKFFRRCVMMDAALGSKYTVNDLLQTDDVWRLVSTRASRLRRVEMKVGNRHELRTCFEAASEVIAPAFETEIDGLKSRYLKTDFSLARNATGAFVQRGAQVPRSFFKQNLENVFSQYLGSTVSAESSLRQYMMLNSMSDFARSYGFARAAMTQESNWRISADLASMYLPILLSVIKEIIYASFIFMVPLMLMGNGFTKYMGYLSVVASLQLWPALNAVLNMFIDLYSASQIRDMAQGVVSFTSYSKVGDYSDKIVAVASGLQMVIPYLAFSVVQGGVSGFINLASTITGASTQAASNVAQEVVSGNKSFDNYSSGNMQVAMQQGFKTDFNASYRAGASEIQNTDGSLERILPDGNTVIQSGAGLTMSGGSVKFNLRSGESSQIADNISDTRNMLASEQASFHSAERSTFGKTASFVANLASRESQGETFDYSKAGEQGIAMQKAVNQIHTLRQQYGYGYDQAATMALKGGVSISADQLAGGMIKTGLDKIGVGGSTIGALGKLGGDINIGVDGNISLSNNSSQSFGDDNQLNREQFTREDYNNVVKVASSEQFARSNNIDTSYSDDVRRSYEEQKSAERSMNMQSDRLESLNRALSRVQSSDGSHDKDMYDEVQKAVASYYGVSQKEAHRMIEGHDPRVDRVWNNMVSSRVLSLVGNEMSEHQEKFEHGNPQERLNMSAQQYQGYVERDYIEDIGETAAEQGINPSDTGFVRNKTQSKVDDMMSSNSQRYETAKQEHEVVEQQRRSGINQYEKDRIGQGKIGKLIGGGGPTNPSTQDTKAGKKTTMSVAKQVPMDR